MKTFKRFFSILLCVVICFSCVCTASATTQSPTITITNTKSLPGDSVKINIIISDNPGIMAMAFCVTYDSDALIYKTYSGGYLSDYKVYDHSDKGHVSFVNVENEDIATNGTIISLLFTVKKDVKPGKYNITLANSNREKYGTNLYNSFSNSNQDFVVPKVIAGGITIEETCENSGHKYGEWNIISEASCTEAGLKEHFCIRCDKVEEVKIPAAHDFDQDWTVDKPATPSEDGIMSRHCKNCDAVTDKITFSYEEIGGDENTSDSDISSENSNIDNESSAPNTKPTINNSVGEKVPLQQVEKFEDYQQILKPNQDNSDIQSKPTSNKDTSSKTENDSSEQPTNDDKNNSSTSNKVPSFFTTPAGIILTAIGSILSIGIIVLCIILILKNKKH